MFKKSIAATFLTAAFSTAWAQDVSTVRNAVEVYDTTPQGSAKYNAMAGAMGALGGDISSVNVNPAGVGVAIASEVSASLLIQSNKNESTLFGEGNSFKINNANVGQAGGILVFNTEGGNTKIKNVNLGFSFSSKSAEEYLESCGQNSITFQFPEDQLQFVRHAYDRTGNVAKTTLAAGANYDHRLYFGIGLNLHNASIDQYDTASMRSVAENLTDSYFKQYTPYGEDGTGFSANIGVIGKINNQIRLGLALETPTWWNIDRSYYYYSPVNSNDDGLYTESRDLRTPMKLSASAAIVPSKNFAFNVDLIQGVSKPKFTTGDKDLENELNSFFEDGKNSTEVRVGAEYRINQFRIRGGYGFASNPFGDRNLYTVAQNNTASQVKYDNLYAGTRNTFGFGLGYDFKSFYVDAAYQNISSKFSNPFLYGNDPAGTQYFSTNYSNPNGYFGNDGSVVSEVKNTQSNFTVTLGWRF